MAKNHTYVLGTGLSHDGSACLLKDGRICVAIEKERVTRIKHDGGNDTAAIQYCLDAEGIGLEDLALVVQNANFGNFERGNSNFLGPRLLAEDLDIPVVTISHHLAHAYSALGTCPFDEPNILVVDGCGNGLDECIDLDGVALPVSPDEDLRHLYFEKDSYYVWRDGRMQVIYKDFSPWGMKMKGYAMLPNTTKHSIGGVYSAASSYCFRDASDLGKLMGLAPYGRPGEFGGEIFELRDGRVFVRYDWMRPFNRPASTQEEFKQNFQYYADLAYWVQREMERALLYLVDARYEMQGGDCLAYAGGVALNAVANARILGRSKFRKIYMVPAAGDNGIALGCAFYGWLEVLKQERVRHAGTPFLGRRYSREETERALWTARDSSLAASRLERPESPGLALLEAVHDSLSVSRMGAWTGSIAWRIESLGEFFSVADGLSCRVFAGEAPAGAVRVSGSRKAILQLFHGYLHPARAVEHGLLTCSNLDALLAFYGQIDWQRLPARLAALERVEEEELVFEEDESYVESAARLLADGKIVAWFQGGSEFGPRALGHRSILADPRRPEVREIINGSVKRREEFRPFAPSVPLADASTYFECDFESPYMILVAQARPEWRDFLPGVVHRDGSARLQTVTPDWNESYFSLLQAFERQAGIPILLNTSFNRKGMPIVESPTDALNFFRESPRLDALVIDRYVVSRFRSERQVGLPHEVKDLVMAGLG